MRNLGGAIGIALIDTVIWSRAPLHADQLLARLRAGDLDVARSIGIPEVYLSGPPSLADPMAQAFVQPLLERAGLVAAINEAWALIAALALVGVPLMILSGLRRTSKFTPVAEPPSRIGVPE
jgi:MFS transporter, DHA2 family, multidrug resistance protein